ncbi:MULTISPECIES: restriction endonuclease subunit S [Acinetobacter]|uniref:restriction endonuclease subunit S n=1 Tax=Acinetobacter TaxID=469 RepID=UPI00321574D3
MSVPKLRFKEFDGNWGKKKISEQFNFHNTNSYSRALLAEQGEIMNIHYGDIHTKFSMLFDVKEEVVPFLSSEIDTNKIAENQFLQVGDLVIADASEDYKDIGKAIEVINLDNKKVVAGLHTYIARPVERCAIGFNGYLMQTFEVREQIKKLATGISVLGISKTNLGKVELKIPCLAEQTKIASFLSAVDEKISQLTQKHALLSQYKQGMMQKLFSQQIRFKADNGSEFGEWEEKELKDIAEINPKSKKLPESFIYIDLESVEKGQLLLQKNIELQDAPSRAQRLLAKGDVLFQMVRPYQQNNYYFNLSGEYVASTGYAQIRTKLDSKFIYYALHEKTFLDEVMNRCTGTSYPAINSSDLSSIEILIPCLEEQTKIANFLSSIDQKIEVVAQQIEQAKQWKKGLLQNMFV